MGSVVLDILLNNNTQQQQQQDLFLSTVVIIKSFFIHSNLFSNEFYIVDFNVV